MMTDNNNDKVYKLNKCIKKRKKRKEAGFKET